MVSISRKQAEEFGLMTVKKFFGLEVANYYVNKKNEDEIEYKMVMKLPFYLLLFIPAHALSFLFCMWDGGIKEFRFCDNEITSERISRWFIKSDKWSALVDLIDNGNKMLTEEEHNGY